MTKTEAIEWLVERYGNDPGVEQALAALSAPPASAEVAPVGWFLHDRHAGWQQVAKEYEGGDATPLYTHPAAVPEAAVREWISVDERLPELGTEVLVYKPACKWGKVQFDTWDEQHEAPLSFSSATIPTGFGWNDEDDFYAISHWMPLPPPPSQAIAAHQEQPK